MDIKKKMRITISKNLECSDSGVKVEIIIELRRETSQSNFKEKLLQNLIDNDLSLM